MKERFKVFLFIPNLQVGGAENTVRQLAIRLNRALIDCCVCCITGEGPFVKSIRDAGIPVIVFEKKGKFDIFIWVKVFRFLRLHSPSIVHSFLFTSGFWVSIPAFIVRHTIPVYSIRSIYEQNPWWVAFIEKWFILPFARKITFVSANAMDSYINKLPSLLRKSIVIPNGVDINRFSQFFSNPDANRIIAVGRLDAAKGYDVLLQAFWLVKKLRPKASLKIVGEGPCRQKLEKLAVDLQLNPQEIFIGESQQIPQLLASSSIYISASLWEGIPNAHLEAMASRKAIIATSVGGVPEILDSRSAYLVPPNNVDELAKGMIALLDNQGLRLKLAHCAWERVQNDFSIESMISKYEAFYQSLLPNDISG